MKIIEDDGPRKEVVRARFAMRWGDMDALGHVNNAIYFRYMEEVRARWFDRIKLPLSQTGQGIVVVNSYCNYRRAITYPSNLEVVMLTGVPGRSSFGTFYEIRDADKPEVLYADGGAKAVWVDREAERSAPLPDYMLEALAQ